MTAAGAIRFGLAVWLALAVAWLALVVAFALLRAALATWDDIKARPPENVIRSGEGP